jgi:beta-alanine degradation protein BauB
MAKAFKVPAAPLGMHRHQHPRVIVAITRGTVQIVEQTGPAWSDVSQTGRAYWQPANPPDAMRADVNAGDNPD